MEWADLADHIASLGFTISRRREVLPLQLPAVEDVRVQIPASLPLPNELEPVVRLPVAPMDLLGLFVPAQHGLLPKGVHLFCDRIQSIAPCVQMCPAALGLSVFWHEITHCHLHIVGPVGYRPTWLRPFDLEEVACESFAYLAIKHGWYAPLGLKTLEIADFWKLARWRTHDRLFPYSWFPNVLGAVDVLGMEAMQSLVFAMVEASIDLEKAECRGAMVLEHPANYLLADLIMLEQGLLTLSQSVLATRAYARPKPLHRGHLPHNSETDYEVFLWGI